METNRGFFFSFWLVAGSNVHCFPLEDFVQGHIMDLLSFSGEYWSEPPRSSTSCCIYRAVLFTVSPTTPLKLLLQATEMFGCCCTAHFTNSLAMQVNRNKTSRREGRGKYSRWCRTGLLLQNYLLNSVLLSIPGFAVRRGVGTDLRVCFGRRSTYPQPAPSC